MSRNHFPSLVSALLCLATITLTSLTLLTGCDAPNVGAAAGAGGAAYVQGELKVTERVSHEVAGRAAEKALKDLKIAFIKREQDEAGISSVIEARTASDQKVFVKTRRISDKSTEVGIRVGMIGDESMSRQILDRMQMNYPTLR